jgi:hypothetical protein
MQNSNDHETRKNLFNKDIITKKILVDSHSIDKSGDHNTSNYTVEFDSSNNPNSYKNVIGFRLISSSISISPFHVEDGRNTFTVATTTITIPHGVYTGTSLATQLATTITANSLSGYSVVFDPSTLKYTISNTSTFVLDFTNSRHVAKILGFNAGSYDTATTHTSGVAGNFTQTYVDLVIPEIPSIVCKDNSRGLAIIDRIPLIQSGGNSLSFYQTNSSEYQSQNYFFPMKLSTLTIKLYQDSDQTILYDSQNGENTFEFEVTILRDTSFMNN